MKIKENSVTVEEYNYLFDKVGWGAYDNNVSKIALDNSFIQYQYMIMIKL